MRRHLIPLCFLFGCAPSARVPLPPSVPQVPPPVAPQFDKTFGSIDVSPGGGLVFRYKSIILAVDPGWDAAAGAALLPQVDYLLLTDAQPRHFSDGVRVTARKNIKIIASEGEAAGVKAAGFSEVKAIGGGQRILLKKNEDFVFVTATSHQNPDLKRQVNSYLIEFDNGRNIFISGEIFDADVLREFVYALRDDGKDVYAGFFYRQSRLDETALAKAVGLIQPKNALVSQNDAAGLSPFNEAAFQEALKAELFEGGAALTSTGQTIPF